MIEKVRNYMQLHHMIEKGDRIVLGVSGGADSVALLLALNQLKEEMEAELFVVHINHGIRREALEDACYVKQLCESCQVPFYLFEADIPAMAKEQKKTEEEMGREFRYQSFYQVMEQVNAKKLAVAHHMGDQAETVLFHLIRGTDLAGMKGMRPVTDWFKGEENENAVRYQIIRPLLKCSKEELKKWLEGQNAAWQEDRTNSDNTYARNRMRNQVIPALEQINEQAVCHVVEFADSIAEYQAFFRKAVTDYMSKEVKAEQSQEKGCVTDRILLKRQPEVLARAVIYEMLVSICGARKDILRDHVQAVYELMDKQSGKKVVLPYQMEAQISYEKLIIRKCFDKETESFQWRKEIVLKELFNGEKRKLQLPQGGNLVIQIKSVKEMTSEERKNLMNTDRISKNSYTKFFDCDTIKDTLYVRMPETGDHIVINDKGNRKKLTRLFMDEKISLKERKSKAVVASGHEILWIVGGRRCENYKIGNDTKYILLLMYEGENDGISY